MNIPDIIALVAGITGAGCFLPQVIQTWQTRDASDVSYLMLLLTLISAVLYSIYALMLGLWPVALMNSIFSALVLIELILKFHFSRKYSKFSDDQ